MNTFFLKMLTVSAMTLVGVLTSADGGEIAWTYTTREIGGGKYGAVIIGYMGTDEVVTVPTTVRDESEGTPVDLPVVAIGAGTFSAHRDEVRVVSLPSSVTDIEPGAFYECKKLESINLPDGVKQIKNDTFSNCVSLRSVDLNRVESIGFKAFNGAGLEAIDIPSTVTNLDAQAFRLCRSLKSVDVPAAIKVLDGTFDGCSALETATLHEGLEVIGGGVFGSCGNLKSIYIPSTVRYIGDKAFNWVDALKEVRISDLETWCKIDFVDNPLDHAEHLYLNGKLVTEVTVPPGITNLGKAFPNDKDIVSLMLPEGLTNVGAYCFSGCSALTNVVIPSTLQSIRRTAFARCGRPMTVRIRDLSAWCAIEMEDVESSPFCNSGGFDSQLICDGEAIHDLVVPDGATQIGNWRFRNCRSITSVTIPDSVRTVGAWVFDGCPLITNVTVGCGVKSIGDTAFNGCKHKVVNITDINAWCEIAFSNSSSNPLFDGATLYLNGEAVTNLEVSAGIGQYAFRCCNGLKSARITGDVVIGKEAFASCGTLSVVELGEGVHEIREEAFEDCTGLVKLVIPNSVTNIVGNTAFHRCVSLRHLMIPACVTSVKDKFFSGWGFPSPYDKITDIALAEGYSALPDGLFTGCAAMTTLSLPASVIEIGEEALSLENTPALKTVYVSPDLPGLTLEKLKDLLWGRNVDIVVFGQMELPALPPQALPEEIKGNLGGFADPDVKKNINDWETYEAFRRWVATVRNVDGTLVGLEGVKQSVFAWLSFVLDSRFLLVRPISDDDLRVEQLEAKTNPAGWFALSIAIDGVAVGASARVPDLGELFGVAGASMLDLSQFSLNNVQTEMESPTAGKLNVNAAPVQKSDSFFMRAKVRKEDPE